MLPAAAISFPPKRLPGLSFLACGAAGWGATPPALRRSPEQTLSGPHPGLSSFWTRPFPAPCPTKPGVGAGKRRAVWEGGTFSGKKRAELLPTLVGLTQPLSISSTSSWLLPARQCIPHPTCLFPGIQPSNTSCWVTPTHLSWTPSTQPQHLCLQLHVLLCCPSTYMWVYPLAPILPMKLQTGVKPLPGPLPLRTLPEKPRGPLRRRGRVRGQGRERDGKLHQDPATTDTLIPGKQCPPCFRGEHLGIRIPHEGIPSPLFPSHSSHPIGSHGRSWESGLRPFSPLPPGEGFGPCPYADIEDQPWRKLVGKWGGS